MTRLQLLIRQTCYQYHIANYSTSVTSHTAGKNREIPAAANVDEQNNSGL